MLKQIQGVPWGLICLCLSGPLLMTFVMGWISRGSSWQYRRLGFDPWVGKIPWRRERLPAGSHHRRSHPWQGHVEEIWWARQIRTQGTPWNCLSICSKTKICLLFIILCLSPTLLSLTGGYPRPPFSGKNQLRALVNKSPGHDRSVSIQTPLLAF